MFECSFNIRMNKYLCSCYKAFNNKSWYLKVLRIDFLTSSEYKKGLDLIGHAFVTPPDDTVDSHGKNIWPITDINNIPVGKVKGEKRRPIIMPLNNLSKGDVLQIRPPKYNTCVYGRPTVPIK